MRTWFWTLLVLAAAVALALVLRDHSGNVLILVQPWRIELSVTFAVLLLLAAFIFMHMLLRILAWLAGSPERFRSWRGIRAQRRDQNLLESGWINILEGRYEHAEKDLSRLLGKTRSRSSKVVAALASARAAHRTGDRQRRDEILERARVSACDDVRLAEAVAVVAAEMYLDDDRPEEALMLLQPLQDASSRYFHATRLLLRAHSQLGDYDRVYELTRILLRRGAIEPSKAAVYIANSTVARLRAAGLEGFKSIWGDLKADEKAVPAVALVAADIHAQAGHHDEAARILEAALKESLDSQLLAAYAQCPPEHASRRIARAEGWLKAHPEDASLLAALGTLCIGGELWGQAERYLLQSMQIRSDMRIHALLGNLYDGLGRPADAAKHWRLASDVAGKLPVLAIARALPAADTRLDPTLVDVTTDSLHAVADYGLASPVAASAADVVSDDFHRKNTDPSPAASIADPVFSSSETEDQYFDTAPIPGVDVSQTSDGPRGRTTHS